jgi:hypothetical protein
MTESQPSSETPHFNREQVVATFRKFIDSGVASPDDLSLDDPEVVAANAIMDSWSDEAERSIRQGSTFEAALEYTLSRSTVYVDAGFADPDYLDEVANDWLAQDLEAAEKAGLTEVAAHIQAKIDEINTKLNHE